MRDRLQTRLGEMKKEFTTGQAGLQELEKQQMYLRETMLRISGAIQVLEELLANGGSAEQNGAHPGEKQPLSGQVHSGNIMDPALQTPGLGGHDYESRQNSPAVDTLGEKE
jgi:hypothetical protein